jgi:hypothetical protein
MAEPQPSKLVMRVRFPSPALLLRCRSEAVSSGPNAPTSSPAGCAQPGPTPVVLPPPPSSPAQRNPEAACAYAEQALQQLAITWYATGMDRILDVRKALQPWAEQDCVQALDDQLYGWQATLSTLQR